MRQLFLLLLTVLLLGLQSPPVLAWNGPGHMTTGAIAYTELQANDPQALAEVIRLLKTLPNYAQLWKRQLDGLATTDPPAEQVLLMLAARWSDDIRNRTFDGANYDRPTWHYVNFAYQPAGQTDSLQPPDPEANPEPNQQNILTALQENLNLLNRNAPDPERAVALCWVAHLVGDIHQPLHTTALFSTAFPTGDRGGTRFYVRVRQGAQMISLHKFWDDLILGSNQFRQVRNRATALRTNPNLVRPQLPELATTNFQDWAKPESYELAKQVAYVNGSLPAGADRNNPALLPTDYTQTAKATAERRAVLAGYRLADLLQAAL
jgi:hypothetical protein